MRRGAVAKNEASGPHTSQLWAVSNFSRKYKSRSSVLYDDHHFANLLNYLDYIKSDVQRTTVRIVLS